MNINSPITKLNNYKIIAKNKSRCYNRGDYMLDKQSIIVLKVLKKLLADSSYKVITTQEIKSNLSVRKDFDEDSISEIIDYLDKQEYINLKFSEDNTYCYSLLPKARILLEQENGKVRKPKEFDLKQYVFIMLASMIGSMLALILFFSLAI